MPFDRLAVEGLLHGDVRHRGGRRGTMPVLFTRREPDDVAGANLLDGTTQALHTATTGEDDQRLSKRMCVPRGSRPRLECHSRPRDTSRSGRLE